MYTKYFHSLRLHISSDKFIKASTSVTLKNKNSHSTYKMEILNTFQRFVILIGLAITSLCYIVLSSDDDDYVIDKTQGLFLPRTNWYSFEEGTNVSLRCHGWCLPLGECPKDGYVPKWTYNDQPLLLRNNISILAGGRKLIIRGITKEFAGKYNCDVETNTGFLHSNPAYLDVETAEEFSKNRDGAESRVVIFAQKLRLAENGTEVTSPLFGPPWGKNPSFVYSLSYVANDSKTGNPENRTTAPPGSQSNPHTITEGDAIRLNCNPRFEPNYRYRWSYNDKPTQFSHHELVIRSATKANAGKYICYMKVSNRIYRSLPVYYDVVKEFRKNATDTYIIMQFPYGELKPSGYAIGKGEHVLLYCMPKFGLDSEKNEYTWFFNDHPITPSPCEGTEKFRIKKFTIKENGKYNCQIKTDTEIIRSDSIDLIVKPENEFLHIDPMFRGLEFSQQMLSNIHLHSGGSPAGA